MNQQKPTDEKRIQSITVNVQNEPVLGSSPPPQLFVWTLLFDLNSNNAPASNCPLTFPCCIPVKDKSFIKANKRGPDSLSVCVKRVFGKGKEGEWRRIMILGWWGGVKKRKRQRWVETKERETLRSSCPVSTVTGLVLLQSEWPRFYSQRVCFVHKWRMPYITVSLTYEQDITLCGRPIGAIAALSVSLTYLDPAFTTLCAADPRDPQIKLSTISIMALYRTRGRMMSGKIETLCLRDISEAARTQLLRIETEDLSVLFDPHFINTLLCFIVK